MCARGLPTIDAYARAGYKRNTGNATALKKRPDVAKRIEEIQYDISRGSQTELTEYIRDVGINPAYIIKNMLEVETEARKAGKYDIALKCWRDVGIELFGMFLDRKHPADEKTNVPTQNNTTINIENLNQALEALGGPDQKVPKIVGDAEYVDLTGALLPGPNSPANKQRRG